jgi:hypothetical protein
VTLVTGNESNELLGPVNPGEARPFIMRVHRGATSDNLVDMTIEMHTELTFLNTVMLQAHTTNDWPHDEDDIRVFWSGGAPPPALPGCEPMQTPHWAQEMLAGEKLDNFVLEVSMVKSTSLFSLRLCEEDWNGDSDWYWTMPEASDFEMGPLETADPNNPGPTRFFFCNAVACGDDHDWDYELIYRRRKDKMDEEDAGGHPPEQSCP